MQISKFNLNVEGEYFVFVSFERHRTFDEIADILYSEDYRTLVLASKAILIRPAVDRQIVSLEEIEEGLQEIIGRFSLSPLYILYSNNFLIKLSDNVNENVSGIIVIEADKAAFIHHFRQMEMQRFITNSSAIIRAPQTETYFRTPSQEYSHNFLRVGNIQTSRQVIDSIFFWALPYLENAGGILTDSWSISSIAFNIPRLLARYVTDNVRKEDIMNNFHVNMLSTHYHGLRSINKETKDSLGPLQYRNEKNILGIISAIKTKKSLVNIRNAIKESGFENKVCFLALYKLTEDIGEDSLCCLDQAFCSANNVSFDSIAEPPPQSKVVPIDEHSFFPIETNDDLIVIKKAGADISKEFFETYAGKGVIQLHRDAEYENGTIVRHHGIYIDLSPMLSCDSFILKLEEKVKGIKDAPACIIFPPHRQGKEFVELISQKLKEKFGYSPRIFCFTELEVTPPSQREAIISFLKGLHKEDNVMVIDDVSISGGRLHTYQKNLLPIYKGKINYVVGIARPVSDEFWQHRKSILSIAGSTLDFIEKVLLPDWNNNTCPWCEEKRKLELLVKTDGYIDLPVCIALQDRVDDLKRSGNKGLLNNAFIKLGKVEKPEFLGGSVFCQKKEISEADMIASVASTIQHLRNGVTNKEGFFHLHSQHPFYSIIHHHDFLHGHQKFFEHFIKASLMRVCRHGELYATKDINRQEQKVFIKAFLEGVKLTEEQKTFFIYELYLAMKLGKLPKPNVPEHLKHILNNYYVTGIALPIAASPEVEVV